MIKEIYNNMNGFSRRLILITLIIVILLPNLSLASSNNDLRVYQMGIMTRDSTNSNRNISRAELATIAVRLMNLEHLKDSQGKSTPFKDVSGWALPYINIASDSELMKGVSSNSFNPSGNLKYGEVLTVIMRILGYEDGVDFKKYPEDYYSKALEIGLADLYISHSETVTREVVANTINKALDLNMKNSSMSLTNMLKSDSSGAKPNVDIPPVVDGKVYLDNLSFNTSIMGIFSGTLKGTSPEGYKVVLLSGSDRILKSTSLDSNGSFSIEAFDIDILTRLQGYKYEVYSPNGNLILWDNLN